MARTELRYLDEAHTKQELVVICSTDELEQRSKKSSELMHKHYQEGVKEEVCDAEWRQFHTHLFGWSLIQRIDEIRLEGLPIRFATEDDHP